MIRLTVVHEYSSKVLLVCLQNLGKRITFAVRVLFFLPDPLSGFQYPVQSGEDRFCDDAFLAVLGEMSLQSGIGSAFLPDTCDLLQ